MDIVATLTTIPDREAACRRCVQSLLNIKPPLQKVVVNIPLKFMRTTKPYPQAAIDALVALDPARVEVRRPAQDMGPGVKFFGFGRGPKTFTFVCDDDRAYSSRLMQALTRRMVKEGAKRRAFPVVQNVKKHRRIMGVHGLLCPPGLIKGYRAFLRRLPKETWEIDDDTFEAFIRRKGVRVVFLPKFFNNTKLFGDAKSPHALSNNRKRRKRIQQRLKRFLLRKGLGK